MENIPESDKAYTDFIEALYDEFAAILTWRNSVTQEIHFTGFSADPKWLPAIRKLLADLTFLHSINTLEIPTFRDFKSKRGWLSIHWDGGDALADEMIDSLENKVNSNL